MSAIDNMAEQIHLLERDLRTKCIQLSDLSNSRRYHPGLRVDVDHRGASLAQLHVKVMACRNVVFNQGVLAGMLVIRVSFLA